MKASMIKDKATETGRRILWKAKDVSERAAVCARNGIRWAMENPEKAAGAAAAGAALLGGANRLVRGVSRNVTARRELYDKKHRVYDHSLNAYVYTKRPLKADDIVKINNRRRETGKRVSEVLAEMDLLKR